MARALFRRITKRELREAARWYESRTPGLGVEFIQSITACVELICSHPEMFPSIYRHVRRALVKRFPFSLLYFSENGNITIISVFHSSRDPQVWRRRV